MFSFLKDAAAVVSYLAESGLRASTSAMQFTTLNMESDDIIMSYFPEYLYRNRARSLYRALRKLTKDQWQHGLIQSRFDAATYKIVAICVLHEAKGVNKARLEDVLNRFEQDCGTWLSPHCLDVLQKRGLSLKTVMQYYS